ncbi:C69 family dipeptidase [Metallumcola ferriviriculae]|uniref:Dipeptidase n=1 Tax=Metallumcola ferriviriculae TaxID=3039180 RepID=A0AAU0ULJ5_9FIRM|nr:C69 family dipeptidase [Desulfitibacteraceae bacterium MK1]
MCDTLVALGNSTSDGSVIFAKNSDRQPNEPHIMVRVPRKKYQQGTKVKCTYIEVDQVEETYEVFLLKPSWIWGCEMGANEFGVNVGNEAVFTKEKYAKTGLLGMDLARLALERAQTSEEALHLITDLLEKYSQGGNCGYEKPFTYHNSFLIADKDAAWVLETAGQYWAAQKVKDIRTISNCLTIEKDFELCHDQLIQHAIDKGWCKSEKDFNFAQCYTDKLITRLSGANQRCKTTHAFLDNNKGNITVEKVASLLRSHDQNIEGKQFKKHSLQSVCMHGGFLFGDHTTGSYIAALNKHQNTYWVTGSSTPCISLFKPLWLIEGERVTFSEDEKENAIEFWQRREQLHRMILENRIADLDEFLTQRDRLELDLQRKIAALSLQDVSQQTLQEIIKYGFEKEEQLLTKTIENNQHNRSHIVGNPYFRYYWGKQNKRLAEEIVK